MVKLFNDPGSGVCGISGKHSHGKHTLAVFTTSVCYRSEELHEACLRRKHTNMSRNQEPENKIIIIIIYTLFIHKLHLVYLFISLYILSVSTLYIIWPSGRS